MYTSCRIMDKFRVSFRDKRKWISLFGEAIYVMYSVGRSGELWKCMPGIYIVKIMRVLHIPLALVIIENVHHREWLHEGVTALYNHLHHTPHINVSSYTCLYILFSHYHYTHYQQTYVQQGKETVSRKPGNISRCKSKCVN